MKLRIVKQCSVTLAMLLLAGCGVAKRTMAAELQKAATPMQQLPALHWQQRSDWVNVKTDVTPKAVGDGKADDTIALQAALSAAKPGSTIYFPPGTYRITSTLQFGARNLVGVNLIGSGRDTHIFWDGIDGGNMLEINGGPQNQYRGLTLDGNNRAGIGVYGFTTNNFITEVVYQDMAFKNFKKAGIYYVPQGKEPGQDHYANAETIYDNCLFENCATGLYSEAFNDYDHTFTGCEFDNCGTGIRFGHGNFYIRDSHFEHSSVVDIQGAGPEHGCSVRRVTSVGSAMFLNFANGVSTIAVEGCNVANWTNAAGAIRLLAPAATLLNNTFSNATIAGPVVQADKQSHRIVSGNTFGGLTKTLFTKAPQEEAMLPASARPGSPVAATQHFLTSDVAIPSKVFDAKVDFGAVGNGRTDDTQAIQKAIDAAKTYGKGAIAYLPAGRYNISNSLNITGADYFVGGAGYGTQLIWKGAAGGSIINVTAPHNIVIENMGVGHGDYNRNGTDAADILQTGSDSATRITYREVFVFGKYQNNPEKGIFLRDLGSKEVVVLDGLQGNIHVENSAAATILANVSYEGIVSISGKSKQRDGFLGFMTRLATGRPYVLIVKNNQSGVFSDFYTEQGHDGLSLSGDADDPPGRITMHCPKMQFDISKKLDMEKPASAAITSDNYAGNVFMLTTQFYTAPKEMQFTLQGTKKMDLYLLGNSFYATSPTFVGKSPSITVHLLGNSGSKDAATNMTANDYPQIVPALDDLQKLGALDLQINFPWIQLTGEAP